MLTIALTWQQAGTVSAGLFGAAAAATAVTKAGRLPSRASRRLTVAAAFAREAGILFGLYALWQLSGYVAKASPSGAVQRGEWIWHFERVVGLPNEAALQRAFLPHPLLVQALNFYYDLLHFPVLLGCLVWLFAWHRDWYRPVRTTVALFTAASLLVALISVAPPRLLPGVGMTDTALAYGQSVYGQHVVADPNQLSAMPSVHVGWALLVAVAIISAARSRWRWLALAYPALTTLAVVVTANHYWLDGIVAGALLALVIAAQRAIRVLGRALQRRALARRGAAAAPVHVPAKAAAATDDEDAAAA